MTQAPNRDDMGWRLAATALAWLAGIAVHLQLRTLPPFAADLACLVAGALALGGALRLRHGFVAAALGAALLAFGLANLRAEARLDDVVRQDLEGIDLAVTGVVASLPQRGATGLRFPFQVESATLEGQPVAIPARLTVGWFQPPHAQGPPKGGPPETLGAGQRWRLTMRLRRPHGNVNPHGYDYELQLLEQGIGATASVREKPAPLMLARQAGFPVERMRQRVRDAIEAKVPDRRAAGLLVALSVGDQGAIAREDWEVYRATGIAHLVSISGLHVTMFAWLAGAAIARAWRRSGRAMLWLPTPLAASWGGLFCAAAYAVFSGGGVPSQRTVWMLAVVTLSRSLGLRWPWPLVLLLAAVVVTAVDPWALTQAGFWLSFAAVGLLMASSRVSEGLEAAAPAPGWRNWPRRAWATVRADLRTQVIATVGLTPLTLVFFQQISLIGFFANLIAIPVITLVVTPLALLGIGANALWIPGAWTVLQLNVALGWLAALPGAVWVAPVAPWWAQWAGLVGAVVLVAPLPWRARLLSLPLLVPLLWPPRDLPPAGGFDMLALDVGQGTSVLIRTRAHLLVFDAGPQYSPESDAGQRIVLPVLKARGETRIDQLMISHRDLDHVGGAAALLEGLPVAEMSSSLEPEHPLHALAANSVRCEAGQGWEWDGVRFEVLRPLAGDYRRSALKPNARSCVLRVSAGERSVLLTGDIEREQEAALLAAVPERLRSDWLIAPHHGSKTSSTAAFLDAVNPKIAIFQAGYRNRFGHPAPEVLRRYEARGVRALASPGCGAYLLRWKGPPAGQCLREAGRRYWHLRWHDRGP